MRFQHALLLLFASALLSQAAIAQSWGQLKSQAIEAQSSKKYAEAVDFWTKALAACQNTQGPRYVQSMSGLAHTYADQEKYAEADTCYKKIAELAGAGTISDDSNSALLDYASILRKQKRDSEASDLETKFSLQTKKTEPAPVQANNPSGSAAIDQKAERNNELKNYQSLLGSGTKELAQKHFIQAEQFFKQALASAEKQGADNKLMGDALNKLIQLYFAQNKLAPAEPYYQRSLLLTRKSSGAESKDYAQALMGHAQLLRQLNRKPEAMAEEARAEKILSKFASSSEANGGSSASQAQQANDPSATRRGSLLQRARSAQSGFTDATNQMINNPD